MSTLSRPRTIITADPELDDLNSMIRLLAYSSEMRIEGLIYASSQFHWRGDGEGSLFFHADREYPEPRESWRWAPGERFIDEAVDAYAEVYANLRVHDERYPDPAALRAVIREGNVDFEGDTSKETPGSQLIADVLLDAEPGPVYIQLWAGPSTLARALMSIEERYAGTPEWPAIRARVSQKAIVTKFASQDDTYDEYIAPVWPDIRVIEVATFAWGYMIRRTIAQRDQEMLSAQWLREHVTSQGALGALYRVWGDGRQMVPGDPTDYFHLSGISADDLRAQGFQVWIDPQPAGEWISEGDTTNMLNLLVPGLRGHEHPSFGGWGGIAVPDGVGSDTWVIGDTGFGRGGDESSVTRWFAEAQADFAVRLRWSVTPDFTAAPHHPTLDVGESDRDVSPGDIVRLNAVAGDRDGGEATVAWWIFAEAGTYTGAAVIAVEAGALPAEASLRVPADAQTGETIHVVAEARGSGNAPLKSYRRVILTVR